MKIVTKQIEENSSKYIIYLMDDNGKPLNAEIVTNEHDKRDGIYQLLEEHFAPEDYDTKESLLSNVEEISYEQYISQ